MTDVSQPVRWALKRACPLRQHRQWRGAGIAQRELADVVAYSRAVAENCISGDICVTSHPSWQSGTLDIVSIPLSGFGISEAFTKYGGAKNVEAACVCCEANVRQTWSTSSRVLTQPR